MIYCLQPNTFAEIDFFFEFPSFIFKENQVIVEEDNPLEKNVTEEPDGIDIDDIVLSMKNVGILKYSLVVESLLDTLTKRRNQAFYKFMYIHSVTNVLCERFLQ